MNRKVHNLVDNLVSRARTIARDIPQKKLKSAVSLIVILIALLFFGEYGESKGKIQTDITPVRIGPNGIEYIDVEGELTSDQNQVKGNTEEETKIVCDISGAVRTPGVYELQDGARLNDLIELAGGLSDEADIDRINRARTVFDGEKIYIPKTGEDIQVIAGSESIKGGSESIEGVSNPNGNSSKSNESGGSVSNGRVNINLATLEELQTITGVGPSTAEKIIAYREEYGGFDRIEELMDISGIGEKTFKKMEDQVTV